MIMPEMKDSGIEWIGKIPEDWNVSRIKFLSKKIFVGLAMPVTKYYVEDGIPMFRNTNIEEDNLRDSDILFLDSHFAKSQSSKWIKTNDVLTVHTGYIGKSCLVPEKYNNALTFTTLITTPDLKKVNPRYLMYCINSSRDKSVIYLVESTAQCNLNTAVFVNLPLPVPPVYVQDSLTSFLDSKCSEIDSVYADIEKQIDLLEWYKKSVITEAITKGIDRNVEMKDSGIEWIGKIPIDWKVEKVKYHLKREEYKNPGNQQVLSVYREYGVIPKDSRDDNHNVTSEDTSKYKYVKPNYLVINKMKAWQGSMGVSDYEGIVSPAYFIYVFKNKLLLPKYIHYLFRSCYKDEFRRISGGIREGQWDLSPEAFNNILLLIPTIKEQSEIIKFINDKVVEIDATITDKKKQLETLDAYKKSLIYEYVTGKKEVSA